MDFRTNIEIFRWQPEKNINLSIIWSEIQNILSVYKFINNIPIEELNAMGTNIINKLIITIVITVRNAFLKIENFYKSIYVI